MSLSAQHRRGWRRQPNSFAIAAGGRVHPCHRSSAAPALSAPFVAGVVAMMKSVNPDLNHDAVAQILREARTLERRPKSRATLDAYAALRRAAGSIDIVKDPLEINDLDTIPSNSGQRQLTVERT